MPEDATLETVLGVGNRISIPKRISNRLNITPEKKSDGSISRVEVTVNIKNLEPKRKRKGDSFDAEVGTNNRVTVPKGIVQKLGLKPNMWVTVTISKKNSDN